MNPFYLAQVLPLLVVCLIAVALAVACIRLRRRIGGMRETLALRETAIRREREQRAEVDAALQLTKRCYDVLFNNARDMVFIHGITPGGLPDTFEQVNDVACEKLEHKRERLQSMTPLDIEATQKPNVVRLYSRTELLTLSDEDIRYRESNSERQLISQIMESAEVRYERVFLSRAGKRVPVEISARRFDLNGQPRILLTARDITERKQSERALNDGRQRLKDFLMRSPIGLAIYDADRKLVTVNQTCLRMFGIPDDVEFENLDLFSGFIVPDDARQPLSRGETVRYEARIDFAEVRRKKLFVTARREDGHFDVLVNNLGVDSEYQPKGYLAEVQDITQRREAEASLGRIERQLRQAQRMEAIGSLSGGIAHDFNNILTPIIGYTEMVLQTVDEDNFVHEYMDEVLKASYRAKELVSQILTFSRQTDHKRSRIHVSPIVKEVLTLIQASLPASLEIRRTFKTEREVVMADPTQIHQVLMNLCTNAMHAMRESGGVLEVIMTDFVLEYRANSEFPYLEPGRYLRISVKDSGTGMDEAVMERIFEPFFTTKASGEGTGMGLAVAHGIVTSLNGTITVDSELGKGSVFHVILPSLEEKAEKRIRAAASLPRGSERVLFVDDEKDIARMAEHMLSSLGYEAVTANSGMDALVQFHSNPDRFDLVITDQVMPEVTGLDLAREVHTLRPKMPILICTGYSEMVAEEDAGDCGVCEVIMKPIVMRHFAESIRRALDGQAAPVEA